MSVTAQTLQNTGPNGVITYSSNYSAAAAVITRHESSDITLNVSDQITTVTVQGTKLSGAADTQVDLLDASATKLDTATVALPTTAGVYNTPVTLTSGTTLYFSVAKVLAVYTASAAPVVISLAAIGDAQLSQQNATTTYGTSSTLFVRTRGVAKNKRTIVQFDVSSIPVGATVSSATLTLCAISPPSPARTYDVHRATGTWVEATVSWALMPTMVATATSSTVTPATPVCMSWTVTADVQTWVSGVANNGWIVKDSVEDGANILSKFRSRENSAVPALLPNLSVTYTP